MNTQRVAVAPPWWAHLNGITTFQAPSTLRGERHWERRPRDAPCSASGHEYDNGEHDNGEHGKHEHGKHEHGKYEHDKHEHGQSASHQHDEHEQHKKREESRASFGRARDARTIS